MTNTTVLFANDATSNLAGSITNVATTANLTPGSGALFPAPAANEYFVGTFVDAATGLLKEIVHVTEISADTITMVRGQEGTTALNWSAGDIFSNLMTAGTAEIFLQNGVLITVPQGGTGVATLNAHGVVIGNGAGNVNVTGTGSATQVLTSKGASADPVFQDVPAAVGVQAATGSSAGAVKTASWSGVNLVAGASLISGFYLGTGLALSFDGSTTGANGMDTGSMPVNGDLSIYAIYNPTSNTWATLGVSGATSHGPVYSGANMPAGYTASALLWVGVTNSGGQIPGFVQKNRSIAIGFISVLTTGSATSYTAVSLTSCVPVAAVSVGGILTQNGGSGADTASTSSGLGPQNINVGGSGTLGISSPFVALQISTAQTIYYLVGTASGATTLSISISSYNF